MGVGVFSSNFDNTGSTFLVSGPLAYEDDYQTYVESSLAGFGIRVSQADNGLWYSTTNGAEDALAAGIYDTKQKCMEVARKQHNIDIQDYESWGQDEYNNVNEHIVNVATKACMKFGIPMDFSSSDASDGMYADNNFLRIASNNTIEVGWRSWESDFVIGVAAGSNLLDVASYVDENEATIINKFGLAPSVFSQLYSNLYSNISEYLRLSLMSAGLECRFRTSGYTTGVFCDEISNERLAELESSIKLSLEMLDEYPDGNIIHQSPESRSALIGALAKLHDSGYYDDNAVNDNAMHIPMFNYELKNVQWFSPYADSILASGVLPDDVIAYMESIATGNEEFTAIPRVPETEVWLNDRQVAYQKNLDSFSVVVTAQEVVKNFGKDLEITLTNEDGAETYVTLASVDNQMRLKM